MSAQTNRKDFLTTSFTYNRRLSVTAAENRPTQDLFSPEEIEGLRLKNLRDKRKQLEQKLKYVSNKINFRKKKEQEELRKFIREEEKSLSLMETTNYKKFNNLLKDQLEQKKQFEKQKKAREVQTFRINAHRRLSLIQQAVQERKIEESEKLRQLKKIDEENLKFSREQTHSLRKEQHELINKMKERQNAKKRCYWFEKRVSFQQKLLEEAQLYEKQVENYYKKIESLKENEQNLRLQEKEAQQVLNVAERNFQLLKQS